MTITKEQFDALKVGDRVLVEATIAGPVDRAGITTASVMGSGLAVSAFVIHSILPRPIRVGDRVKVKGCTENCRVVHIDDDYAMLRWVSGYGVSIAQVSSLEIIP